MKKCMLLRIKPEAYSVPHIVVRGNGEHGSGCARSLLFAVFLFRGRRM